jgi:type IV pilus assembly protein PilE
LGNWSEGANGGRLAEKKTDGGVGMKAWAGRPTAYLEKGFSLIELVFALGIIGILAAIAIPSYTQYMTDARRGEAKTTLMEVMQEQEKFYTENGSYAGNTANLPKYNNSPIVSQNGYYQITAAACSGATLAQCVLLTATPQGVQSGDGQITLDSRGVRTPQDYWD